MKDNSIAAEIKSTQPASSNPSAVELSSAQKPVVLASGEEEFNRWLQKYCIQQHEDVPEVLFHAAKKEYPAAWLFLYILNKEEQINIAPYSAKDCYEKIVKNKRWFEGLGRKEKNMDPGQYQYLLGCFHEFFTENNKHKKQMVLAYQSAKVCGHLEACYRLGRHYENLGKSDLALKQYEYVHERNKNHKYALGGIHRLNPKKSSASSLHKPSDKKLAVKSDRQQDGEKQLPQTGLGTSANRSSLEAVMFAKPDHEPASKIEEDDDMDDIRDPRAQCVFGEEFLQDGLAELTAGDSNAAEDWFKKAVELFEESATARHPQAQYQLGECYRHGYGVARDEWVAADYYKRAAHLKHKDAQYELAECHHLGRGVKKKDMKEARKWYELAAAQGHRDAQQCLDEFFTSHASATIIKENAVSAIPISSSSRFFRVVIHRQKVINYQRLFQHNLKPL